MADALASGASVLRDVGVQVPLRPQLSSSTNCRHEGHEPEMGRDLCVWWVLAVGVGQINRCGTSLCKSPARSLEVLQGRLPAAQPGVSTHCSEPGHPCPHRCHSYAMIRAGRLLVLAVVPGLCSRARHRRLIRWQCFVRGGEAPRTERSERD